MASPTVPGCSDAPITATARGSRIRATARASARCSRRSTLSRNSSVSASSQSRSTTPESNRRWSGQPALANTASMARLSPSTSAVNRSMPLLRAMAARCSSMQRGDAGSLVGVGDHERRLGFVASGPALVARPGDELVMGLDGQGRSVDHVDVGEVEEFLLAELGLGGEEPPVDALGGLAAVELGEGRPIVGGEWADEDGVAVAEHHRGCPGRVGGRRSAHSFSMSAPSRVAYRCDVCCCGPSNA